MLPWIIFLHSTYWFPVFLDNLQRRAFALLCLWKEQQQWCDKFSQWRKSDSRQRAMPQCAEPSCSNDQKHLKLGVFFSISYTTNDTYLKIKAVAPFCGTSDEARINCFYWYDCWKSVQNDQSQKKLLLFDWDTETWWWFRFVLIWFSIFCDQRPLQLHWKYPGPNLARYSQGGKKHTTKQTGSRNARHTAK